MFTLKLYQNGPLPPEGRSVIVETVGLWVDELENGVKHIRAFRKDVGVMDEGGTPEFYVGGNMYSKGPPPIPSSAEPLVLEMGRGGNYFSWAVLENSQGKTTQVFR